ncbi:hypothetical protein AM593_06218, partial [Mytilus galloprovincialis]
LVNCSASSSTDAGPVSFAWYKDGEPVLFYRRVQVRDNGSLYFTQAVFPLFFLFVPYSVFLIFQPLIIPLFFILFYQFSLFAIFSAHYSQLTLSPLYVVLFFAGNVELDPGITIHPAPSVVISQKNSPLLVNCSASSSTDAGPVSFAWYKDGEPVLFYRRVQVRDNGSLYFTQVKNNRCFSSFLFVCPLFCVPYISATHYSLILYSFLSIFSICYIFCPLFPTV